MCGVSQRRKRNKDLTLTETRPCASHIFYFIIYLLVKLLFNQINEETEYRSLSLPKVTLVFLKSMFAPHHAISINKHLLRKRHFPGHWHLIITSYYHNTASSPQHNPAR